jgi:NAD(P)-dependent dehydrogenase (short-subunit alcohol dehydrogenase family)
VTDAGARLLEGKTMVVTGAGGGVGRGIALTCATHGANVVIAARRTETGDVVAGEIEARGGAARSIRCDVAQRADVEAAVACAVDEFGALDVMVHNALAPVGDPRPIEDVPDATWQSMLGTAVRASYLCAQIAYPHLEANRGSLILITSAAGVDSEMPRVNPSAVSASSQWWGAAATVLTVAPSTPHCRPQPLASTRTPSATAASIVKSAAPAMPSVGTTNTSDPELARSGVAQARASHQAASRLRSQPSAHSSSERSTNRCGASTPGASHVCTTWSMPCRRASAAVTASRTASSDSKVQSSGSASMPSDSIPSRTPSAREPSPVTTTLRSVIGPI